MKYKPKQNIFTRQNRVRASLLVFLILGSVSLTTTIGLNAQGNQDPNEEERFLLKTLRLIDSMAKRAERFKTKGEMKKAKFFGEYFQKGASIDEFEMADLNQIANDVTKEETAIVLEQNKLLKPKKLTKEERSQLTPEELKALRAEKTRKLREHRKELKVLNEEREGFRKRYLDMVYETVSPDALVRLQEFVKSKVTIRREELKDESSKGDFTSVKFQPASHKPSVTSPGGGKYAEIWGLLLVFHDAPNQKVVGIAETLGACSYSEGSGGGGGPGEPLFLDANFGLILGGYDVPCDVTSVYAALRDPNNIVLDTDESELLESWDIAEAWVEGSVNAAGNYCVAGNHYVQYDSIELGLNTNVCVQVEGSQEPIVTNVTSTGATKISPTDSNNKPQILGNPGINHFVTPKGAANDKVTLTATISPDTQANRDNIDWEGATEDPSNPLKATVSKASTSKNVVKIKYNNSVLKELRVWVIWSTIAVSNAPQINSVPNVGTGNPTGPALFLETTYDFIHTILPASFTDVNEGDRVYLGNANVTPPPGNLHPLYKVTLTGGAHKKWDASRQIRFKLLNPNNISIMETGFYPFSPVNDLLSYPSNLTEGNDDFAVGDEFGNDPYFGNSHALNNTDTVGAGIKHIAGNNGDTYEIRFHFNEFTRLEIEGIWQRISDPLPWKVHYIWRKVNGQWIDDGSFTSEDNSGF